MSKTRQQRGAQTAQTTDQDGDVETLRQILIKQSHADIGYEEAKEVGATLIEFYELLALEVDDESLE